MIIDDYPYKKFHVSEEDINRRFKNLQRYRLKFGSGKALIFNLPVQHHTFQGLYQYILTDPSDYNEYNEVTDYFSEQERLKAQWRHQELSPHDYWVHNKDFIMKRTIEKYHKVNSYTLRETLYEIYPECTGFKISTFVGLVKHFSLKKVLDFSAGWGDRLIGALASNLDFYCGIDPNSNLHPCYKEIIRFFKGDPKKFRMICDRFEVAVLPNIQFDGCITSPPFYDLEVYTDPNDPTQSIYQRSLDQWFNEFLMFSIRKTLDYIKSGGWLILNLNNVDRREDFTLRMVSTTIETCSVYYHGCLPQSDGNPRKSAQPFWIFQKK